MTGTDPIAFMADPATHGGPVEHVETHISHVFLTGERAYKMKKAVTLDFLDFSTLERRRAACEAELRVNARTARDLYIDVAAINQGDGRLWIGPPEAPVEYLVRMHRFDQEALLDRMAARHALDLATVRAFADAVADLHLDAEVIPPAAIPERFSTTLETLLAGLDGALPGDLRPRLDAWRRGVEPLARHLAPRLEARARRGGVRHGNGDLHLRNACRFRGEVVLFDAIEFAPRFSHIDVLYDAAFAAMDLRHRGEEAAAIAFLSRYLAATRDYGEAEALRVFLSVRAGVRALVSALSPDGAAEAAAYLDLALEALGPAPEARLVAVGGRSGTGKSTLAAALAPRLARAPDVAVLRSDEIRKRLLGYRPDAALPASAYRGSVTAAVQRRMLRDAGRALDAGASAILDATFLDAPQREALPALAAAHGRRFEGLWLSADAATLAARLSRRGVDASDADARIMQAQPGQRTVAGWHGIDTEAGAEAALAEAAAALGLAE